MFNANFKSLFEHTVCELEEWSNLPITGRINGVKMNILPIFLFLFQTLPILIQKSLFASNDKIVSNFMWNKKTPRMGFLS